MGPVTDTNPCEPIQADLSAMLDGELEPVSVRRVLVHVDACPCCKAFFDGIRQQALAHRSLHAALVGGETELVELPATDGKKVHWTAAALRDELAQNRSRLGQILYELGKAYVLMGLSPKFWRIVSTEPVPIPDVAQQGRHLVAEVERLQDGAVGQEWERARRIFGESWIKTPEERLEKGIDLLREALILRPESYETRIYLGHALHVAGFPEQARDVFENVLTQSDDREARGFAFLHLGNVHLEAGRLDQARDAFLQLVESGAVAERPELGPVYFNLALTMGLCGDLDACATWLGRLADELPHRVPQVRKEIEARPDFRDAVSRDPAFYSSLCTRFPMWFSDSDL